MDNFDLRRYLTEQKQTTAPQHIVESVTKLLNEEMTPGEFKKETGLDSSIIMHMFDDIKEELIEAVKYTLERIPGGNTEKPRNINYFAQRILAAIFYGLDDADIWGTETPWRKQVAKQIAASIPEPPMNPTFNNPRGVAEE
jgi:hypothetical protein